MSEYEYRILQLLDRLSTLPSPHPIHFFTLDECKVIVMSTMPGRVRAIGHGMPSEDRVRLLREVQAYMTRTNHAMAACRETVRTLTSGAISDLDGLRCLKFPLLDGFLNVPVHLANFVDEMSTNTPQISSMVQLQKSILHQLSDSSKRETIRFCHMDLHPGNILIRNGKISGIVDWNSPAGTRALWTPSPP